MLGESREDHVALLGVRGNGALIFASVENAAQMLSEAGAGDRFLVFAKHAAMQRQTPDYESREKVEGASAHTGP